MTSRTLRAVSNSSPLIHLSAISRLHLLRHFHETVLIPPAVWREVVEEGKGRPGAAEVEKARHEGWLTVIPPVDQFLVRALSADLDQGEAEAIVLALEQSPVVLLLDERRARLRARTYSLRLTGVIGILIRARRTGLIPSLRVALQELTEKSGFWIHKTVFDAALKAVGEK